MNTGNRIDSTFATLKHQHKKALIGYVTAGFPSKGAFLKLIPQLERAGLDVLEIGMPFSDPIADGPTIQRASETALKEGVRLRWVLAAVRQLRRHVQIPMIIMSYANPILAMGLEAFFKKAARAGIDGLIVPDLIPEEGKPFEKAAARYGVDVIFLAAPTTPPARLAHIARATHGFLYAVSLAGITGARKTLPPDARGLLRRLRPLTHKPIAMGFGIGRPQQVRALRLAVDGIIVGSALIQAISQSPNGSHAPAVRLIESLQRALNPSRKETAYAA